MPAATGPQLSELLTGIRVIDLTRLTPGAYCTMLLADAGADVIKVEEPSLGDYSRWEEDRVGSHSIHFYLHNRGKRSIALDLKRPEHREVLFHLAQTADVFIESFRPGVADRLGIGHETVRRLNPRLVYCSLSGYGQSGPLRDRVGHDVNYFARAGILALARDPEGDPLLPNVIAGDLGGGLMCAFAIVTALLGRERTGKGQYIDIAMTDVLIQWLIDFAGHYIATGDTPKAGEAMYLGGCAGYNVYRTSDDKHVAVGALEQKFWIRLCDRLGREDLASQDPLAVGEAGRRLREELAGEFRRRTRAEWERAFSDGEVPCDPVLDIGEALSSEHVAARDMLVSIATVEGTPINVLGSPIKGADGSPPLARQTRGLGADTNEILRELGRDDR